MPRTTLPADTFIARTRALAESGDASAAELMGEITQRGELGVTRDYATACTWFERAAATRADGGQNLANCFFYGQGRARDDAAARRWYARAADGGWPSASCALGNMLIVGRGGPKDETRGLALCRAGAVAGDANAATDYGGYLLSGTGGRRDPAEARRWLTDAAQQKQANAAFLLGQIYWNGDGTPADRTVAIRWWRVAYEGGRVDAARLLGREAFARVADQAQREKQVNNATLAEAREWLEVAAAKDPDASARAEAARMLGLLDQLVGKGR